MDGVWCYFHVDNGMIRLMMMMNVNIYYDDVWRSSEIVKFTSERLRERESESDNRLFGLNERDVNREYN